MGFESKCVVFLPLENEANQEASKQVRWIQYVLGVHNQ